MSGRRIVWVMLITAVVIILLGIAIIVNHSESSAGLAIKKSKPIPGQSGFGDGPKKPESATRPLATANTAYKTEHVGKTDSNIDQLTDDLPMMTKEQEAMLTVIMGDLGAAARELYSMPPDKVTAMLLQMFSSPNSSADVRNRVVKVGMIMGISSMKELFWKGLDDRDENIRGSAIRAWLATGLDIDGLENKINYLLNNDKSSNVREIAAQYFFERPEDVGTAVKELHAVLKEGNERIVWKAAFALTSATINVPGLKDTMTALYVKYQNSPDVMQRSIASVAAGYLARNGDLGYKDAIQKFLSNEDENVRAGAVLGMPAFKNDPRMMATLAEHVRNETGTASFYALSIVAQEIKNPALEQACTEVLYRMPNDSSHSLPRLNAALALSAIGKKRDGFEIVYSQLHDLVGRNCVFRRVACTRLQRASQMNLPCNIFSDLPEKEWDAYIKSL